MRLLLFALLQAVATVAATAAAAQSAGAAGTTPVAIEAQTYDGTTVYATRYRASSANCSITWIAYNNEPGVVKYEPDCPALLAEQLPLMAAIGSSFLASDRNAPAFRTFFWGTLAPDSAAGSHEMSYRLAAAAFGASGWDKVRGQPKEGDINGFVRDLANQAGIYPELTELFASFQRTVRLAHAEKVLVAKAGQLPFFPQLEALGVRAADRLPFDCMAWFAITTAPE